MPVSKRTKRLRFFSIGLIIYMCAAFTWWAVLLRKRTIEIHILKVEVLQKQGLSPAEEARQMQNLEEKLTNQNNMILGEAIFFGLSLSISFWFVYRSYRQALQVSKNQTNFLLAITHELKTPIASISLILETILKRKLKEEQKLKLGNDAMRETRRLDSLVNNLLLSAQLDSNYKPFPEYLDLCNICQTIIEEYRDKHPKAVFEVSCGRNLPKIYADKQGISAIVHNLVGNAIKYNENIPEIKIHISATAKEINLSVADNGTGISDAEKKQVFERFYRSGNEATRKTKGTGLGLFITKEIVKAHKGRIRIENNSPSGVVFIVTLPIE